MVTKQEVEESIKNKDDFIKIDYLNRFLKQADNLDMKKFLLLNLAAVNENKNMLHEAIRNVTSAGDIAITYREKRELYMKEVELWVKLGNFDMAEKSFHKALGYGNDLEKQQMEEQYVELFRVRGNILESKGKNRNAIEVYEKLLNIAKVISQKYEVKDKLLDLYGKTGKMREHDRLKKREF